MKNIPRHIRGLQIRRRDVFPFLTRRTLTLVAVEAIYAILRAGWDIAHVLTSHITLGVKVCFTVIAIGMGFLSILIVYLKFRGGK